MSFICKNGSTHSHQTVIESKICWGILRPPAPPTPVVDLITKRQRDYIEVLGGDLTYAAKLNKAEASDYISKLRMIPKPMPVPEEKKRVTDPRLDMLKGLIDMIPTGYYAVTPQSGAHIDFLRLSRPKVTARTQFRGSLKIQTQHGPSLDLAAVLWQSGNWSIYKNTVIDMLMLLVTDHHTAAMRYAKEIGTCMRCNAELTDDRSRHYGIGPECETKMGWGWVIPVTDERNGMSFEVMRSRGLINLR